MKKMRWAAPAAVLLALLLLGGCAGGGKPALVQDALSSAASADSSGPQADGSAPEETPPASESASNDASAPVEGSAPIDAWTYQSLLGRGMDVDWAKTDQGRENYTAQTARDFAAAGVRHVRIRVRDAADPALLRTLDAQVADCLAQGLIPVVAYQADALKNDPSDANLEEVVRWWRTVAEHYRDASWLLSFDLIIEVTDALNRQPERLNTIYGALIAAIRESNPQRIVMISPRLRSDPAYLAELAIPAGETEYLMAEWHFYASGPSKDNPRKLWTTGTAQEKQLIADKIALALDWQEETGIPTWVGAWMPGDYNEKNCYTVAEQAQFAAFVTESLTRAAIPFAVNADTHFYDRESGDWIAEMQPVFGAIFG